MIIQKLISIKEELNLNEINQLLSSYSFVDYRTYRIKKTFLDNYLFSQIKELTKSKSNCLIIARKKEKIIGLITLIDLPWDTDIFGIKMAKIGHIIGGSTDGQNILIKNELINSIIQVCKDKKILHLSCRIDVEDFSSFYVLEKNGFNLMDTVVTYVYDKIKHSIPRIKDIYKVEGFKKDDLTYLRRLAKGSFSKHRFYLDPHIPQRKADYLYEQWIKNACLNKKRDRVLIAKKNDKTPVGFLIYRLNERIFKYTGCRIIGEGLAAISPEGKGAFPSLLKAALNNEIKSIDYAEFDSLIHNYEAIKVYRKFGLDFVRGKYTFHKWLGDSIQ